MITMLLITHRHRPRVNKDGAKQGGIDHVTFTAVSAKMTSELLFTLPSIKRHPKLKLVLGDREWHKGLSTLVQLRLLRQSMEVKSVPGVSLPDFRLRAASAVAAKVFELGEFLRECVEQGRTTKSFWPEMQAAVLAQPQLPGVSLGLCSICRYSITGNCKFVCQQCPDFVACSQCQDEHDHDMMRVKRQPPPPPLPVPGAKKAKVDNMAAARFVDPSDPDGPSKKQK